MTDAMEDRDPSYEMVKSKVEWPEEADAGVELHTPYPKTPALERYSDVMWNPWTMDEIEGESRGTAASGGNGEGVEEANWAFAPKMTGQREVNPSTEDDAKSNPKEEGDTKSNPGEGDDAKSNPHVPTHAQSNFDDAEFTSRPMDLKNTLSDGQHLPS